MCEAILNKLDSDLFEMPDDGTLAWFVSSVDKVDCVCFALRVKKDAMLPSVFYEITEIEGLIAALCLLYKHVGEPLKGKTQADVEKGYFDKQQDGRILLAIDTTQPKETVDFSWTDSIEIENTMDIDTAVTYMTHGRKSKLEEALSAEFTAEKLPVNDVNWEDPAIQLGSLFKKKELGDTQTPQAKRSRKTPSKSPSPDGAAAAPSQFSNQVTERLAAMKRKDGPSA